MKTVYQDIAIEYDEQSNAWKFELRGRSRSAASLSKAKEAIDKEPVEKRKPFPKFDAWLWAYHERQLVTVTSVAEPGYSGGVNFWCSYKGTRKKEQATRLFPVNDHNNAIFQTIDEKEKERNRVAAEIDKLKSQLQTATIPKELE